MRESLCSTPMLFSPLCCSILADNQLTGTLPPEWGYNHSLFRTLVGM